MPEELENWEKYGFPDPRFYPPYLPINGICKAIIERGGTINIPDCLQIVNVPQVLSTIDSAIQLLLNSQFFLNPDKLGNLPTGWGPDYFNWNLIRWTWEDLLLAGANGIQGDQITIDSLKFGPEFPARYLIQRYKMINLLKYRQINFSRYDVSGYSPYSGAVVETYLQILQQGMSPSQYWTDNPHADLDYYESLSRLRLQVTQNCNAVFPVGITGINTSYLIGFYEDPSSHPPRELGLTGGVIDDWGWNYRTADRNGVFWNFDYTDYEPLYIDINWIGYCRAFTDYSEIYNFKEENSDA